MKLSLPLIMTEDFDSIRRSNSVGKVTIYQGRSQYALTSILIDSSPLLAIRTTFRKTSHTRSIKQNLDGSRPPHASSYKHQTWSSDLDSSGELAMYRISNLFTEGELLARCDVGSHEFRKHGQH